MAFLWGRCSHRRPLFGQQKRDQCLELREGERHEGRSPELGCDCVCQNQSVTSFMQQIRSVRTVSGPTWGLFLHLSKYRWHTGAGLAWASITAPAERPDWQPLSGASLLIMSGNVEPLPSPGGRAGTGGHCRAGSPWLGLIVRLIAAPPPYPQTPHSVTIPVIQDGSKEQANGLLRSVVLKL